MSEINALKLDLPPPEEYNVLQRELYLPTIQEEELDSRFTYDLVKRSAGSHTKIKMGHMVNESEIIYTASKKFDTLFKSEMITELPAVRVKEKYKATVSICYPRNLGHHIIVKGELRINDDPYQALDSKYLDIWSQYYQKAGMRDLYDEMIGNIPCLTQWSSELPTYPVTTPQPWLFSRKTNTGLLLLKSDNTVTFVFERRVKLTDIIRMRVKIKSKKDGDYQYKEIPCNLNYLEVKSPDIPIPELWGRYYLMTDAEREWRKNNGNTYSIWYDDIIITSSNNPVPLGSKAIIPLHSKYPVRHVFWLVQNIKTIKNRNYSNYTTDINDMYNGFGPCMTAGIKYGGSDRVAELPYYHFTRSETYDFFSSAPCEPGYHVYTFSSEPNTINSDTTVDISTLNSTLVLKVGDTNIFKSFDTVTEELDEEGQAIPIEALEEDKAYLLKREQFIVHVRLVVYKKLEMTWSKEEGKLKYNLVDESGL